MADVFSELSNGSLSSDESKCNGDVTSPCGKYSHKDEEEERMQVDESFEESSKTLSIIKDDALSSKYTNGHCEQTVTEIVDGGLDDAETNLNDRGGDVMDGIEALSNCIYKEGFRANHNEGQTSALANDDEMATNESEEQSATTNDHEVGSIVVNEAIKCDDKSPLELMKNDDSGVKVLKVPEKCPKNLQELDGGTENSVKNKNHDSAPDGSTTNKNLTTDDCSASEGFIKNENKTAKSDESSPDSSTTNDKSTVDGSRANENIDTPAKGNNSTPHGDATNKKSATEGDGSTLDGSTTNESSATPSKGDGSASTNENSTVATPEVTKPGKKSKKIDIPITPRRSSRNLNKKQTYTDDVDIDMLMAEEPTPKEHRKKGSMLATASQEDDEIQVITPQDPLGGPKTVVVNDSKGLAKFAASAQASSASGHKKEPTIVIIDTKSLLAGKGPIPLSTKSSPNTATRHAHPSSGLSISYPRLQQFARSSLTISPLRSTAPTPTIGHHKNQAPPPPIKPIIVAPPVRPVKPPTPPPPELPHLTDDMWVVEAPSFIVPYVYEKPGVVSLKEHITKMEVVVKKKIEEEEAKKKEEEEAKRKEEEEKKMEEEAKKKEEEEKKKEGGEAKEEGDEVEGKQKDGSKNEEVDNEKMKENVKSETNEKVEATSKVEESSTKKVAGPSIPEKKPAAPTYFDSSLGKFFIGLGLNLVQEQVQADLLRAQKRKRDKEGSKSDPEMIKAIDALTASLEFSKENNQPFRIPLQKCQLCSYRTESRLAMAHHLDTPHMKNYTYRCNFCPLEVRSPHDILFHMEAEHNVRGRLERAPAYHQCANCPFEDNMKKKMTRHLVACVKRYRPERNQEPPMDWEPPAKIPKQARPQLLNNYMMHNKNVYQAGALIGKGSNTMVPKLMPVPGQQQGSGKNASPGMRMNQQIRNQIGNKFVPGQYAGKGVAPTGNVAYRASLSTQQQQAQIFQQSLKNQQAAANKLMQQPSISITPLPRASTTNSTSNKSSKASTSGTQPPAASQYQAATTAPKGSGFVVCEVCDGYIKDLDQLRNHMLWIHKVKIHPKMIYNRPPLNCQKCQFRFFTDQGLERHLLGSHGLVTSSMQEAANKGKDGGRCPICGRVYQWKLLNHVARDHNLSLKPAHLSYKCTVCTATFGMYKQFESHVYSAHTLVAKRALDKKSGPPSSQAAQNQNEQSSKQLKISDEITIIPQPARATPKTDTQPTTSTGDKTAEKTDA